MSNPPNSKHPPTIAEQIAQIGNNLKQLREVIEEPEFTYATYQKVIKLASEIRGTAVAIAQSNEATEYYRQIARNAISELSRMVGMATRKLKQYTVASQKQQRAQQKMQRPDKT
jgi:hypothetical protein